MKEKNVALDLMKTECLINLKEIHMQCELRCYTEIEEEREEGELVRTRSGL